MEKITSPVSSRSALLYFAVHSLHGKNHPVRNIANMITLRQIVWMGKIDMRRTKLSANWNSEIWKHSFYIHLGLHEFGAPENNIKDATFPMILAISFKFWTKHFLLGTLNWMTLMRGTRVLYSTSKYGQVFPYKHCLSKHNINKCHIVLIISG